MTKIKINIKNKAFFQVTWIRRHGKVNFCLLICVILRLCYDPKLHFYYVTVPKAAKKRERNSRKREKREHFVIYIMIIKKLILVSIDLS